MSEREIVYVANEAFHADVSRPVGMAQEGSGPDRVRIHRHGSVEDASAAVMAQVAQWQEGLPAAFDAAGLPYVEPALWSARSCRFYAQGGRVGTYRRQAAALYPFAAPIFDHHEGLRGLVDAGMPFEGTLLGVLRGLMAEYRREGFTLAKLRRMRGLRDEFRLYWIVEVLSVVSMMPLDRVPVGSEAWRWVFKDIEALSLLTLDESTGLRMLATLPGPRTGGRLFRTGCIMELEDLIDRCAFTLVRPMLACDQGTAKAVAGQLLLGGVSFLRACAISDRWHANHAAFDRALPRGEDRSTWPALFEPFERDGMRILCLTAPSMLRDEGLADEDDEGVAGLSHCVGGYAPQAWTGECHILSVRRRVGEGWERVSTAELAAHAIPAGGVRVGLRQHKGTGNREPAHDATRALDELLVGLRNGSYPHDPAALARRPVEDYDDGIMWSSTEVVEATLSAWRPHLPRDARGLGPEGMRERLAAIRARVVAMGVAGGRDTGLPEGDSRPSITPCVAGPSKPSP